MLSFFFALGGTTACQIQHVQCYTKFVDLVNTHKDN